MKKTAIAYALLTGFIISTLISCKDDEAGPVLQFVTDNRTIQLNDAKLYLKIEGSYTGDYDGAIEYTYRDYLISDGDLIEGENGWSLSDYTNATYFIAFELATPKPELPGVGNYPLHRYWDGVTDGSRLSYFFAGFDEQKVDTPESNPSPVINIQGGTEPNEKMTIEFSGKLAYRSATSDLIPFDGKLNFTGTVIDKRD